MEEAAATCRRRKGTSSQGQGRFAGRGTNTNRFNEDVNGDLIGFVTCVKVNAAVDGMNQEKVRLEATIEECRIELRSQDNSRKALELENRRLIDRVNNMDEQLVHYCLIYTHDLILSSLINFLTVM